MIVNVVALCVRKRPKVDTNGVEGPCASFKSYTGMDVMLNGPKQSGFHDR